MKEYLISLASNPANWAIALILLIQLYKLVRPSLPASIVNAGDEVTSFLSWAIPSSYQTTQELEKNGIISKSSKLSVFIDKLVEESAKQQIVLSAADLLKAKAIVGGIAASDKSPLASSPVSMLPSGQSKAL